MHERSRREPESQPLQGRLKNKCQCCEREDDGERARSNRIGSSWRSARLPKNEDDGQRSWNTAEKQPTDDRPIHAPAEAERSCGGYFCCCGKQKISSDRDRR